MFGIIRLAAASLFGATQWWKNWNDDMDSKIRSKEKGNDTWIDRKGRIRDMKTDDVLFMDHEMWLGEEQHYLRTLNGKIVRDLSAEDRKKRSEIAKSKGLRAFHRHDGIHQHWKEIECGNEGFWYYDAERLGSILLERKYKGIEVYVNYTTREVIDFTDSFKKSRNEYGYGITEEDRKLLAEVKAGNYFPFGQRTKIYNK